MTSKNRNVPIWISRLIWQLYLGVLQRTGYFSFDLRVLWEKWLTGSRSGASGYSTSSITLLTERLHLR